MLLFRSLFFATIQVCNHDFFPHFFYRHSLIFFSESLRYCGIHAISYALVLILCLVSNKQHKFLSVGGYLVVFLRSNRCVRLFFGFSSVLTVAILIVAAIAPRDDSVGILGNWDARRLCVSIFCVVHGLALPILITRYISVIYAHNNLLFVPPDTRVKTFSST